MAAWSSESLEALIKASPSLMSALSNAAAWLYEQAPHINWAGFYLLKRDTLILGPFRGRPACDSIALQKGVCGLAAREGRVVRVADVTSFPGHIACDAQSRSEIVLPLFLKSGEERQLWGVLDMDSSLLNRFSDEDEALLSACARVLERVISTLGPALI